MSNLRKIILIGLVSGLAGVLVAGIALPVVAGIGISAKQSADAFTDMPGELEGNSMNVRSRLVDKDGKTIAYFYEENRKYVPLKRISQRMQDAILAIEDDRFYERGPIDLQGTVRAFISNVEAGHTTGGGSTLTQQYVKQVRLANAETKKEQRAVLASTGVKGYKRKLQELRMAVSVEEKLTKDQILERYLNIAYFGNGAYGVQAAAETYYGKNARKLTTREAALLAGMVQNPLQYDPGEHKSAARNRRDVVINRMVETGRLSQKAGKVARTKPLGVNIERRNNGCVGSDAGFFCDYVVNELQTIKALGKTSDERIHTLQTGGLTIQTTLDSKAQAAAQDAVSDRVAPTDSAVGSLVSVQPSNGFIRALANSRIYGVDEKKPGVSNLNYAVDWKMGGGSGIQPGSAFKPFVLAAALEKGYSTGYTINSPSPWSGGGKSWKTCDGWATAEYGWNPKNSTGPEEGGSFSIRTGTYQSINTFYIQLSQRTGLCRPARIAEQSGVYRADAGQALEINKKGKVVEKRSKYLEQVPSFALGVNLVSPLSMASGYSTFANDGKNCKVTSIGDIKNRSGKTIVGHHNPKCKKVIDESVADGVTSVLRGVMTSGTGRSAQLYGESAAGKTGTTNDGVAVWFVGYTDEYATASVVADVDGSLTSLDGRTFNGSYVGTAFGSTLAGPVWQNYMNDVH